MPSKRTEDYSIELSTAEHFQMEKGEIGFAFFNRAGRLEIKPLFEIEQDHPELGRVLEDRLGKTWDKWLPPGYPDVQADHSDLYRSLMREINQFVDFGDSRIDALFASWIICSGVPEFFGVSPRLIFQGLTESGKTAALKMIAQFACHGHNPVLPSVASLYRSIHLYRTTFALDEIQDLPPEVYTQVMAVFQGGGFDGSPIDRCDTEDTDQVDFFRTRAFMAVSVKGKQLKEDEMNRAMVINMKQSSREDLLPAPNEATDSDERMKLRGDLLAFWLRIRSGKIDIEEWKQKAWDMLSRSITIDGKDHQFNGRARDIATVLIVPPLIFQDEQTLEDVLSLILESKMRSDNASRETPQAKTFFAVVELAGGNSAFWTHPIKVKDIKDQMAVHLEDEEEHGFAEKLTTFKVRGYLETLGFRLEAGSGRYPILNLSLKRNRETFEACRRRFGKA